MAPETRTIPITVAALYKFADLPDFAAHRQPLQDLCERHRVKGTLLLAPEGINGTIAGTRDGIDPVIAYITGDMAMRDPELKESFAREQPFYRMKVRLKKEIVTMGVEGIDPNRAVGTYVAPQDWNALISDPDTIVIDTRNGYEVGIGTFEGAIDPGTDTFRAFPDWFAAREDLTPAALSGKKVAMFCTGGIRCEKATAFVKQQGVDQVFHLKGGILKYLETVPEADSLWHGECFVFDQRVSVKHGLRLGSYDLCRACRVPLSAEDKASPAFEEGVSCPACIDRFSEGDRNRFRERHRQVALAEQRGEPHIGKVFDPATDDDGQDDVT